MHGQTRYNAPSRFLAEIPDELIVGRRKRFGLGREYRRGVSRSPHRPPRVPAPRERESGPRIDYSDAQLAPDDVPYRVNQMVEHPIFGAGRIMEVVGAGPAAKATIKFERAGVKVIKLKYAQLRLVG